MEDIAAAAGVSKVILYRVFATKDDIIAAVLRFGQDGVQEALACSPDPALVLRRALDFARREPAIFLVLFRSSRDHPVHGGAYRAIADFTARQLLVLIAHPPLEAAPHAVQLATAAMTAFLHEAMCRQITDAPPQDDEAFVTWCGTMVEAWRRASLGRATD